jgi:phosphate-selective porin OprO/OprP
LLVRNVRLLAEDDKDPVVNVLIRNNKVDIVTKDKVPIDASTTIIDAQEGFLLGQLNLGEAPSFLILDQDPRLDFDVLLDTKTYAKLALRNGVVMLNEYGIVARESAASADESRGVWLAYTPPPMMLPSNYRDTSKWNRWETRLTSGIFAGAVALDRTRWLSQSDASFGQVGDLDDTAGGEVRAFRFGVIGTLNFDQPWVYTIFGATSAFDGGFDQNSDDDFQWFDYRVDIPFYGDTTLSIGKQKEPISMERLTSLIFLPMQERPAALDAMLPARNHGIVLSGNAFEDRVAWAGGIFNNFIDSDEPMSDTASQFVGRLSGVPWRSADSSNLIHLGLGARYSNAKQGVRYASEPEFNLAPVFIDTGAGLTDPIIGADHTLTWDAELAWRRGPLWLSGEYVRTDVAGSVADGVAAGDLTFDGYYISGVWSLTGEMRKYLPSGGVFSRPPVAKSVYQDGIGAWELMVRYSHADMDDGIVRGGKTDIASAGIRWWLTPEFSFDLNLRYITLKDAFGTGHSAGLNGRLVLSLE